MAQPDLVSLNIPETDLKAIKDAFTVLRSKLMPHLTVLSPQDRSELPKMGEKSMAFVVKSGEYAGKFPDLVPSYLDVDALNVDVAALQVLRDLSQEITPIQQAIDDTLMAAGSEAYQGALMFYGNSRAAAKAKSPNAQAVYNDLSTRFPGRGSLKAVAK